MSDARRYAVWPDPRSMSRSLKGSRPSVPHGTNFWQLVPITERLHQFKAETVNTSKPCNWTVGSDSQYDAIHYASKKKTAAYTSKNYV